MANSIIFAFFAMPSLVLPVPAPTQSEPLPPNVPKQRADEIEYLDSLDNWRDAKQMWKEANPHENLKTYKKAYIKGFIDKLPWEEYLPEERTEGYVQNEEQNDDSIWKRISDKPNNTT